MTFAHWFKYINQKQGRPTKWNYSDRVHMSITVFMFNILTGSGRCRWHSVNPCPISTTGLLQTSCSPVWLISVSGDEYVQWLNNFWSVLWVISTVCSQEDNSSDIPYFEITKSLTMVILYYYSRYWKALRSPTQIIICKALKINKIKDNQASIWNL